MSNTASEFIKSKGGPLAVAQAIGVPPGRVRMWSLRERIPRSAWPDILDAIPAVSMDDLRATEAATPRQASSEAA